MSTVQVRELIKREDGSVSGVGNSIEVSIEEAVKLIENGECVAQKHAIGVVPDAWTKSAPKPKKQKDVEKDGED